MLLFIWSQEEHYKIINSDPDSGPESHSAALTGQGSLFW